MAYTILAGLIGIASIPAGRAIGRRRDRQTLGCVLGFLFGPIGLVVLLVYRVFPESAKRRDFRARVKAGDEEWRKRWGTNGSAVTPTNPAASAHRTPTT